MNIPKDSTLETAVRSQEATPGGTAHQSVAASVIWSVVDTWGSKLAQFVVFLILARLLSPADLGLAASSAVLLLFATQIAEFGFGDAIVQSKEIEARDINAPFFFSIAISLLMTLIIHVCSGMIEKALGVHGIGAVLYVSAGVAPLTTLSLFQEAINRRAFSFRKLAIRSFLAQCGGGIISITAALLGAGVWSLIIQAYSAALISNVWMWSSPLWTPSFAVRLDKFWKLARFGSAIVLTRLLDFVTTRALDFIILTFYGAAALGLYTAGSRLYIMLLQLLQQVVNNVALAYLSRLSHDRSKLASTYLQTSLASSYFAAPVFFLCAAVAPELTVTFFGPRWIGTAALAQPLLFLGAVQCVQFVNGSYFSAVGRPHYTFYLNAIKAVITLSVLIGTRHRGIEQSVMFFCMAQLIPTPLNFYFLAREVHLSGWILASRIGSVLLVGVASAVCTIFLREPLLPYIASPFFRGIVLGLIFAVLYLGGSWLSLPRLSRQAWTFALDQTIRYRRKK